MPYEIWRMMALDSAKIDGRKELTFFGTEETNGDAKSIRDEEEKKIAEFLFRNHSLNHFIIEEFIDYNGHYTIIQEVKKPLILDSNEKPGDIDTVIIPNENESEAIAIEIKCFKSKTNEINEVIVNKSEKIKKATKQVNSYLRLGFHKTYFVIVLVDDSREDKTPNAMLRRSEHEKIEQIFWEHNYEEIDSNIGIVFVHISQTLKKSYELSYSARIKTKRIAIPRSQNDRTTYCLKQMLYG